ncbi:MAG TPA: Lrp/AsnC ligand binding domain-containing protein [Nitrososphaeraceae archaeon]|nr:Lrp/AsnC ligand binding domain-containing protein [Nitrososphaeraceae archaeon]
MENGRTEETTKNLMEIDEILEIHEIYNKFDLMIKIRSKDLDDLRNIIVNGILSIKYIKETELITVLRTRKEEQMISLNKEIERKSKEFF